jgi:sugar/nucleoside kinase (ribokinase family)
MKPESPTIDCLCAGIIVADFVCAPIARVPAPGGLEMTDAITLSIGGCAANVAVDLTRIGKRVAVIGRVGRDFPGQFVKERLQAAAVETKYLTESPDCQTSGTLVINVQHEDRRFVHTFGANAEFDGTEVSRELLERSRALYLGGFFLMPKLSVRRVADLFREARARQIPTILDVVIPDPTRCWDELQLVLPYTDVFLPNTDEGWQITGLTAPVEQARALRDAGARTVIVTCGGGGSVLADATGFYEASSFPVEFVDGTGSGDAFCAGYISGLLDGRSPLECLEMGSALGASCVRQAGATTGVFDQAELAEFLAREKISIRRLPS